MGDEKPQDGVAMLIEWARRQAGLAGNGHIDENERFKLRGIVAAIDAERQDFTKAPVSIAAARAARDRDSKGYSPREALIEELRDIDAGDFAPDALLIFHRIPTGPGTWTTGWRFAGFNTLEAIGMAACGAELLIGNMRDA